ncbi:MAG: GNAT family N-acetyltransferase [Planktotalea sp.]|uniref:GNAT family N-acetyltransferase n=1 Tax=Planktotalea sp. TaxID=2029877 RepID=UPI003C75AB0A
MSLHLRAARSTDAGKLGAMLSEAVAANAWKPKVHTGAEDIAHLGELIARGWVNVCENSGVVAGFLVLEDYKVQSLYVAGNFQNAGIGTVLLQHAMQGQSRLELWTFQANKGAQRFYLRHGFHEAERTNGAGNEEGLPDIRYVWVNPDKESKNG